MTHKFDRIAALKERVGIIVLAFVAVTVSQTFAQENPAKPRPTPTVGETLQAKAKERASREAPPGLEELLSGAMKHHPELVAAQAKITMAAAELKGKQTEVTREMIKLREDWQNCIKNLAEAEFAELSTEAMEKGDMTFYPMTGTSREEYLRKNREIADGMLISARAELAKIKKQMQLLTGDDSQLVQTDTQALPPPRRIPEGMVVTKIKSTLDKQTEVHFVEVPLHDVLAYFTDSKGIKFSYNSAELKSVKEDPTTVLVNLELNVPFRSVLQAIEDDHPKLQFVVRDYGILLTTQKDAEERGFVPAVDFGKNSITPASFVTTPKAYLEAKNLRQSLEAAKDQLKRDGRAAYIDRLTEFEVREAIKKTIENYEARIREQMKTDPEVMRQLQEFEEFRPIYQIIANDGAWPMGASWDIRYEFQHEGIKIKGIQPHLQIEVPDEGRGFGLPIVGLANGEPSK